MFLHFQNLETLIFKNQLCLIASVFCQILVKKSAVDLFK